MSEPTFIRRCNCEVCAEETDFVSYDGEAEWCKQCGHNEQTLYPDPMPGGCPEHPKAGHHIGFGLAGGGFGDYKYCAECSRVFDKNLWPDDVA